MKKHYKSLKQEEFDTIKKLQELGVSNPEIGRITGRASSTLSTIKRSNDFLDYHSIMEGMRKPKVKPIVTKPTEAPQEDILLVLTNINESLVKLNQRLVWVEDNMPAKSKLKLWG